VSAFARAGVLKRRAQIEVLNWGDIDFNQETMSVTRSIVYGVVGPCKTESSQKPVPLHRALARALVAWRNCSTYSKRDDWVFASKRYRGRRPYLGQAILRKYIPHRTTCRNSKAVRMAHLPALVLDCAAKCGD
jgi:hypothetical protein